MSAMAMPPVVAVVDDDSAVRKAVGRLLKSAGFDALTFASAHEFLRDDRQKDVACVVFRICGWNNRLLSERPQVRILLLIYVQKSAEG